MPIQPLFVHIFPLLSANFTRLSADFVDLLPTQLRKVRLHKPDSPEKSESIEQKNRRRHHLKPY